MPGYQDETWWSRLAVPNLHVWTPAEPLRMVQPEKAKDDPKALSCYEQDRGHFHIRTEPGKTGDTLRIRILRHNHPPFTVRF